MRTRSTSHLLLRLAGALLAVGVGACTAAPSSRDATVLPNPVHDPADTSGDQVAVLAGGCFWGLQAVFEHVRGVKHVWAGYSGGSAATASYYRVGEGDTGHAESVKIVYDPKVVSYGQLLKVYFSVATDPTQLNRQYPDVGTQYRSEIFTTSAAQKQVAEDYVKQLTAAKVYDAPIVTVIAPLKAFYNAEAYHQDYYRTHPDSSYIVRFDAPKVQNLKRLMPQLYQTEQALADAQSR